MKLKTIEIQGFKSFVDRTKLEFDEGITAILGPNGCGKSNVVDAIRWVLGEQSAKQLRGGKMDDVIFKGTTKRRPVSMAEVTLTFTNDDRGINLEFNEVAIKRRVTRDGGSDYFLNGSPCRLKDLRDLFFDSGVNNTSYSIIEESMIKQILNENNTELRQLLEEGSGITKYKARRKETQRKLDRTQNDLVRLYDIIEEIGREVRSLQRQVGKARRYQRLFKEIRALDLAAARRRHMQLENDETESREKLEIFRTEAETGVGELAELQAKIEAARPTLDERESERRGLEAALQAFDEELKETERQVLVMQHRIEEHQRRIEDNTLGIAEAEESRKATEGQIERMTEHLRRVEAELEGAGSLLEERTESLQVLEARLAADRQALDEASARNLEVIESDATQRSQLRELQVKQENRKERMEILAEDREAVLQKGAAAEGELAQLRQTAEAEAARRREVLEELASLERNETELEMNVPRLQEEVSVLTGKLQAARSTHELLKQLDEGYEGYDQGSREILQRHGGESRVTGGLADLLKVDQADAPVLELLLDRLLDAVVVDGADSALELVQELRRDELGQVQFLCGGGFQTEQSPRLDAPAGGTCALDLVSGAGLDIPALHNLLARSVVFDTDELAARAARSHAGQGALVCVSREGLLVTSDGTLRGGKDGAEDSGLLGRKEKLAEIEAELGHLETRLSTAQEAVATNRSRREELREQLIAGRGRLGQCDDVLGKLQVQSAQLEHQRETAGTRAAEMDAERARLAEEVAQLARQEESLTDLLEENNQLRASSTMRRDELREKVQEAEMDRDTARGELEELRLAHQQRVSNRRETETALEHLREKVAEQISRRERLTQEIEVARQASEELSEQLGERREVLARGMDDRERRRQVLRAAAEGIQALHEETNQWHERVQVIEKQRGGFRDQAHEMETKLATLDIKRNNLEERIEEQYKGSFADLIASLNEEDLPRELEMEDGVLQLDQAEALLADKRDKLGSLGAINHLALEEYETKKERLEFLEKQRDDVEKARDDLVKAITEINRTAKKRFVETFENVRRNYIAVFGTLFKGGRADLQLVKTDDPLESHLHVTAQPTGKVIDTVSLLSGGERCLTALSLLFAVYLVKPSPFCVLDEADAPLDDANIGRFVNMLREFSRNTQFLVITHNKLTMETANHLYGVTMMEPGCSNIVSVSFHDVADSQSDRELGNAIANRRSMVDSVEDEKARRSGQGAMDFGGDEVLAEVEVLDGVEGATVEGAEGAEDAVNAGDEDETRKAGAQDMAGAEDPADDANVDEGPQEDIAEEDDREEDDSDTMEASQ